MIPHMKAQLIFMGMKQKQIENWKLVKFDDFVNEKLFLTKHIGIDLHENEE